MSSLSPLDAQIQRIRGGLAGIWGETYAVYRINSATNDSIVSGSPAIAAFNAVTNKITQKIRIENEAFTLQVFEADCDNTQLQMQDVLVQSGFKSDGRVYTYAQQRPGLPTLFMLTPLSGFLSRPHPGAGNPEQQPTSGAVFIEEQGAIDEMSEQMLVLHNGVYSWQDAGGPLAGATIYFGMQPTTRIRDGKDLGTPTDLPEEHFVFYLPLVGAETIERKDRINVGNSTGDRYEVLSISTSTEVGLTGSVVIAGMLG